MSIEETQPVPWRRGYEWADGRGEFASKGIDDATDGFGYDFASPDWELFMTGAEFRQAEQLQDISGYDYLDEK